MTNEADEIWLKAQKARDAYYAFIGNDDEENVDQENAIDGGTQYGTCEYWTLMLASARLRKESQ